MDLAKALQRTVTVIKNLTYLPGVLSPVDQTALWSEFRPGNYESVHHFAHALRATVLPLYAPFREVPHLPYEVPEQGQAIEDNQAWYFLNGICTDRNVLRLNGKALADLFQRRVYLMHNPSDGIVLDLLECAAGRTMQPISTLETSVAQILMEALDTHNKVVLIAHSQGGIIATGALYKLARQLTGSRSLLLNKLELYTFASAATELVLPQVYAEHFCHRQDYVARIGVLGNADRFSGRIFECDGSGHLLNAHYLSHFVERRFEARDTGSSKLMEKLHPTVITGETVTESPAAH
ncbi:hypothetical protein [Marinobacter caseinilyticus]|uniref:alpha/beta hydrolase n=1 Tax=Marinobacter caseinilyticus TaxID=2692195 RepID=UPI00140B251C|nr:hypothetical protein [Marinobacter caseinilyticus]